MYLMYAGGVGLKTRSRGREGVVYPSEGVDEQIADDYTAEALTAIPSDILEAGVCPEQARMATYPSSLMTEWWWSGTVGAWAKMCNLTDASLTHNLRHVS
jgi:thymidylate synthase (FAD)